MKYNYKKIQDLSSRTTKSYRQSSLLSLITFHWMSDVIRMGNTRSLHEDDLLPIQPGDEMRHMTEKLDLEWSEELRRNQSSGKAPRLWRCVVKVIPLRDWLLLVGLLSLYIPCGIAIPTLLSIIVSLLVRERSGAMTSLWACAVVLPVVLLVKSVVYYSYCFEAERLGMKLRSALRGVIYNKILLVDKETLQRFDRGHVMALCTNDVQRFEYLLIWMSGVVSCVPITVCYMVQLASMAGVAAIAGLGFILFLVPYMGLSFKLASAYRGLTAQATDKRIGIITECVTGIRNLKCLGLEENYENKIREIRRTEMKNIFHKNIVTSGINIVWTVFIGIFSFFCSLGVLVSGDNLTPSTVFLILAMGGVLSLEIPTAQYGVLLIAEVTRSLHRVQEFLVLPNLSTADAKRTKAQVPEEVECGVDQKEPSSGSQNVDGAGAGTSDESRGGGESESAEEAGGITLSSVTCIAYEDNNNVLINDITVQLPEGSLTAVTGPVGSGKTSLLLTISGELPLASGELYCKGRVAYVPETPWLFSGTIKENIIFHERYKDDWYRQVVKACQLVEDLQKFPDGDEMVVGERGVVLSGGQQARVSLARAVYAKADVYLLDDPLRSLDVNVGKAIMDDCINGLLSSKTRVLVTHSEYCMMRADKVLLIEEGCVEREFECSDEREIEDLAALAVDGQASLGLDSTKDTSETEDSARRPVQQPTGIFIDEEDIVIGNISWGIYLRYLTAGVTGIALLLMAVVFIIAQVVSTAMDVWLSHLSTLDHAHQQIRDNILIFLSLVIGAIAINAIAVILFYFICCKSSYSLHQQMVSSIIHAPVYFFDTTPVGRILNRFSKDIGITDELLPVQLVLTTQIGLGQVMAVSMASFTNPWVLIGSVPLVVLFGWMTRYYLKASRQIKRMESVLRSPVISHISETMSGLETIRTRGCQKIFINRLYELQDHHSKAYIMSLGGQRWLSLRVELLCVGLVLIVGAAAVLTGEYSVLLGLGLTYSVNLGRMSQALIQRFSTVEIFMTSVERVTSYTELEEEPGYRIPYVPPGDWPNSGQVTLDNIKLRYYEGGPEILKGVTCKFEGRKNTGIMGRTGSGKSSLVAALMRMPEADGKIFVDGIDISTVNIRETRKRMSILSQSPVIFRGSIRENLDPYGEFADSEIWGTLERVQMRDVVENLESRLHYKLMDEGSNLSLGERQLICLARVLLRKNRILILDEPTAHVDPLTTEKIQQALREELCDCTIVTIAHLPTSLTECDRVLTMREGRITV
ncbi:ATP-binding cassette sub-family C member 4 isoform X2 [Nematostella vectensis]|uniref:ATP-binding cassette sub-family C member 4 isoform X2 n=1 Tax=Nematostella vectensis TaxID=45351 RepID=UPI002076DE3C|nr:ATP-binding cassette sub-family C member 4 isoform X2 [Nematostella vectensis]